jgi:hypothetical protein
MICRGSQEQEDVSGL